MSNFDPIKTLLVVVDQEYLEEIDIKEIVRNKKLFNSLVKTAEINGLYYYFIHRLKELDVDLPFLDLKRWQEELKKLGEFKNTIELLNKASYDAGIDFAIIKACNSIPHIPRDIDIFIRHEDRIQMIEALENKGFRSVQSGSTETSLKGRNIKIDIYTEICYVTIEFMDGEFLLNSIVEDKVFGVTYPSLSADPHFLLLLVHSIFGHRSMTLLDFLHLKTLRKEVRIERIREYAYEKGWGQVFDLMIERWNRLYEDYYDEKSTVFFPYLFEQKFVLNCISMIDDLELNRRKKLFLYLSLVQDRLIFQLKDSFIYNILKSFETTRNLINTLTAYVKVLRGDKKSMNK